MNDRCSIRQIRNLLRILFELEIFLDVKKMRFEKIMERKQQACVNFQTKITRKSVEIQDTQYTIGALCCSSNRSNRSSRNGTPKITQPNPTWLLYQSSQTLERILGPSSIGRTRGQINLPDRCNIREDEFRGGRGFHGFRSVTSPICLANHSSYALRESFSRSGEFLSVSLFLSRCRAIYIVEKVRSRYQSSRTSHCFHRGYRWSPAFEYFAASRSFITREPSRRVVALTWSRSTFFSLIIKWQRTV